MDKDELEKAKPLLWAVAVAASLSSSRVTPRDSVAEADFVVKAFIERFGGKDGGKA